MKKRGRPRKDNAEQAVTPVDHSASKKGEPQKPTLFTIQTGESRESIEGDAAQAEAEFARLDKAGKVTVISITDITSNPNYVATQIRKKMHPDRIAEYGDLYAAEKVGEMPTSGLLPAVRIIYDTVLDTHWVVDGFHRIAGAQQAEASTIRAYVVKSRFAVAMHLALGGNAAHGAPLTNQDKRKKITTYLSTLSDDDAGLVSASEIARICRVSVPLASAVKTEMGFESGLVRLPDGRIIDKPKGRDRGGERLRIVSQEDIKKPRSADHAGFPISDPDQGRAYEEGSIIGDALHKASLELNQVIAVIKGDHHNFFNRYASDIQKQTTIAKIAIKAVENLLPFCECRACTELPYAPESEKSLCEICGSRAEGGVLYNSGIMTEDDYKRYIAIHPDSSIERYLQSVSGDDIVDGEDNVSDDDLEEYPNNIVDGEDDVSDDDTGGVDSLDEDDVSDDDTGGVDSLDEDDI